MAFRPVTAEQSGWSGDGVRGEGLCPGAPPGQLPEINFRPFGRSWYFGEIGLYLCLPSNAQLHPQIASNRFLTVQSLPLALLKNDCTKFRSGLHRKRCEHWS